MVFVDRNEGVSQTALRGENLGEAQVQRPRGTSLPGVLKQQQRGQYDSTVMGDEDREEDGGQAGSGCVRLTGHCRGSDFG